jgi:hypothetical protein
MGRKIIALIPARCGISANKNSFAICKLRTCGIKINIVVTGFSFNVRIDVFAIKMLSENYGF